MGSTADFPPWHPLSTVSEHIDECSCNGRKGNVEVVRAYGTSFYACQNCGGYVP